MSLNLFFTLSSCPIKVFDKLIFKTVCSATLTSYKYEISLLASLDMILSKKWKTQALIILRWWNCDEEAFFSTKISYNTHKLYFAYFLASADQSTLYQNCLLRLIIPINKGVNKRVIGWWLQIIFLINKLAACQRVLMLSDQTSLIWSYVYFTNIR